MIRVLYCRTCRPGGSCSELAAKKGLTPEDRSRGWKQRFEFVALTQPDLICDLCSQPISGTIAVAQTSWRSEEGNQPGLWERQHGNILTAEAVQVHDAMTKT